MRPLSTYSPLNAMGQGYAPLAILSNNSVKNTLNIVNSYKEEKKTEADSVSISDEAKELFGFSNTKEDDQASPVDEEEIEKAETMKQVLNFGLKVSKDINDAGDEERLRDLAERDKKVKQRVQAQQRAAGNLAGGPPSYSYEIGPDGKQYAVEGHTNIKVRSGFTAEERLKNAQKAERAALSGDGSATPQSAKLAAEAKQEARKAQEEIEKETRAKEDNSQKNKQTEKSSSEESDNWYLKAANNGYKESLNSTHQRLD